MSAPPESAVIWIAGTIITVGLTVLVTRFFSKRGTGEDADAEPPRWTRLHQRLDEQDKKHEEMMRALIELRAKR